MKPYWFSKSSVVCIFSLLVTILALMFLDSFRPSMALFSNDAPLGGISAAAWRTPSNFTGVWADLNWLGGPAGALPSLTYTLLWLAGPVGFAKFYAPLALLVLGLAAWLFFRRNGFHPGVCILASFAAALNMNVFSNSCWGLASRGLMLASVFFALAMFPRRGERFQFMRLLLSGFGVGMGIMEGFDIGAIYSLYVAAFAVFVGLIAPGVLAKRLAVGIGKTAVIALAAGFLACSALITLVQTQIQGMVGMKQDEGSKEQRWSDATQWSFPKLETLRVIIPGLFGYRMDTPQGGNYWGTVGRQEGWEQHHQGLARHSGSGEYAGVLVVLVAIWGFSQTFRRTHAAFTDAERKLVWFWTGAALVSLLLAYGKHAPFYRLVYALPYFSTIRNPIKFMHPFQLAVGILFGYGLQGLWRLYLEVPAAKGIAVAGSIRSRWKNALAADRRWIMASVAAFAASLFGWLVFASSKTELVKYLTANFDDGTAAAMLQLKKPEGASALLAEVILRFSNREIGEYVFFLALAVGLVAALILGFFSKRPKLAAILLGLLVVVDLGRANRHWISYYDYQDKYASNLMISLLQDKPYEHRVTAPQFLVPPQMSFFAQICNDWLQHHFQYYNIQSLDVIQMRVIPEDYAAFNSSFPTIPQQTRKWELTNTRYVLGVAGYLDSLNTQIDPVQKRFRIHTPFELYQEAPGGPILVRTNAAGPFALFEFTGALPRARLFAEWTVSTNDTATLKTLADTNFNPHATVLVAMPPDGKPNPAAPKREPGNVLISSYAPKRVELAAQVNNPAILLLNDKYDPNWKVTVNGKPAPLLRCNYLMRGVFLEPGEKTVVFTFEPPLTGLYVSLGALGLGVFLAAFLAFVDGRAYRE